MGTFLLRIFSNTQEAALIPSCCLTLAVIATWVSSHRFYLPPPAMLLNTGGTRSVFHILKTNLEFHINHPTEGLHVFRCGKGLAT